MAAFEQWRKFVAEERNSPEAPEHITGVPAADVRAAARLYAPAATARSITAWASPSTARVPPWSWAWPTSPWRPATSAKTASASIRCADKTTCRAPATWARSRTNSPDTAMFPIIPCARHSKKDWNVPLQSEPGLRIPNMIDAALDGTFKGLYVQGEDIVQSDPNTQHISAGLGGHGVRGHPGSVPERNRELRARIPAGIVVPRKGRHLHQRGAAHRPCAQG